MFRSAAFRLLRLISISSLLFAVPALAQFEIAPDHFDSEGKNAATHSTAAKNKAVTPASNAAGAVTVHGKTRPIAAARKKPAAARKIAVAKLQAQ